MDSAFKKVFDELEIKYLHKLQAVGRKNALNERSVIERIWVQKSHSHVPGFEKYSDQKNLGNVSITLNLDGKMIESLKKREQIIELSSTQFTDEKVIDNVSDRVPVLDDKSEK